MVFIPKLLLEHFFFSKVSDIVPTMIRTSYVQFSINFALIFKTYSTLRYYENYFVGLISKINSMAMHLAHNMLNSDSVQVTSSLRQDSDKQTRTADNFPKTLSKTASVPKTLFPSKNFA